MFNQCSWDLIMGNLIPQLHSKPLHYTLKWSLITEPVSRQRAGPVPSESKSRRVTQMIGLYRTSLWAGVKMKYNSVWRFPWHSPNRVETHWFKTLQTPGIKLQRSRAGIRESPLCFLKPGLSWSFTRFFFLLCLLCPLGFGRLNLRTSCSECGWRAEVGHSGVFNFLNSMWNPICLLNPASGWAAWPR